MKQCMTLVMFALIASSLHAQSSTDGYLDQNSKIVYNDANYLIFEDVGRQTHANDSGQTVGMTFGRFIRLHIFRDGTKYDVDLTTTGYGTPSPDPLISTEVKNIRYNDKDNVWIIARQGHRGDGAILFNIVTQTEGDAFSGIADSLSISPDGTMLAYACPSEDGRKVAVFVSHTMVYPTLMDGYFFNKLWMDFLAPRTRTGVALGAALKQYPTSKLTARPNWIDSSGICITIKETPDSPVGGEAFNYTVSNLENQKAVNRLSGITIKKIAIVK